MNNIIQFASDGETRAAEEAHRAKMNRHIAYKQEAIKSLVAWLQHTEIDDQAAILFCEFNKVVTIIWGMTREQREYEAKSAARDKSRDK